MGMITMTLPYDISRCANDACKFRHNCMRFLSRPKVGYISYCKFEPNEKDCDHQIKCSEKDLFEED